MKLKQILLSAFLVLTFIPIAIVSILLYKSGWELSKESYVRNLMESINVQADYISQTIENNMVFNSRFLRQQFTPIPGGEINLHLPKNELFTAFQIYLENTEDQISVCILLDETNTPLYSIGEGNAQHSVIAQLPQLSSLNGQLIMEFDLGDGAYSLGMITPVRDDNQAYLGSLVSVYNKSYIFKIISSYYKVADTSTYICRSNGDVINARTLSDAKQNEAVQQALIALTLTQGGLIDMEIEHTPVSGYYAAINNSPWYLVGFIDRTLVNEFANQFIYIYIIILLGVFAADICLALYFSRRVVAPVNGLIEVMEAYLDNLEHSQDMKPTDLCKTGYYETNYLWNKFLELMKTIALVRHNFEGIYQLYQSSVMDDINIDLEVEAQTASSNKPEFQQLMDTLVIPEGACVVERFTRCFCDKDQALLMSILENMRDKHLSVTKEAEVYTPYLGEKWFHILIVPMYENEKLARMFIQLRDVSSFKKQQYESIEQARRDPLTGLYNRAGFTESVTKALSEKALHQDQHGLLFIDMNYFKQVNDSFGHSAGDALLCSVGRTLQNTAGHENITSRFGGDEFAIFLPYTTAEDMATLKESLNRQLYYPFQTDGVSFTVSASIGTALWDNTSLESFEALLHRADEAMYQAKRNFKRNIPIQ